MRQKDPNNFPSKGVVVLDSSNGATYTLDVNLGNYFRINDSSDISILEPKNLRDGDSIVLDITTGITNTVEFDSIFTQNGVSIGTVTNTSGWIILQGVYNNSKIEIISSAGLGATIEGDLILNGNLILADTVWDDLRAPATAINPPGQVSDPDWDNTNGGWLFDATGTEVLWIILQMPHGWKEGTAIKPHLHWMPTNTNTGNVLWRMEYKWTNYLDTDAALFAEVDVLDAGDGTALKHQIAGFGEIDGTGKNLSSMLSIKLSRIGGDVTDTYNADALLKEFDVHYQIDGIGSDEEFVK